MALSRGFRNRNPGNIRHGDKWRGLAPEQLYKAFGTFVAPEYGIRAMAVILNNYQVKNGISTIQGIISRWAPPTENDTESYVKDVAKACGVNPTETILIKPLLPKLIPAIIMHENGSQPYPVEVIAKGISLA